MGLLGVYELNRPDLLRDLFVWAYERSCGRYSTVRQLLGEPDPFRMRYRELMVKSVSEVVRSRLDKGQAAARIKAFSLGWVPVADQPRFIEVVETELLNLHEGNIARYRVSVRRNSMAGSSTGNRGSLDGPGIPGSQVSQVFSRQLE